MLIEKKFGSYNDRRYSKPWGALITFDDGIRPSYHFKGRFDGGYGGYAGSVVLEAEAGDIVAFGQKDIRRGNNTRNDLYIVQPDGKLGESVDEATARDHWRARQKPAANPLWSYSDAELLAEVRRRGLGVEAA